MRKILLILSGLIISSSMLFSCGNNKNYDDLTPEQKQSEYVKFQKDSVRLCTQDERLAKAAVEGAFDRVAENNGYWKRDKVTVNYDDSLQCWVGTVDYHYDRNNTYFKGSKTFYVKYWYETTTGFAKNGKLYYTVTE